MRHRAAAAAFALLGCYACDQATGPDTGVAPAIGVADDVLFVVLGKMSLYDQSVEGVISLRNHHFVAEIMPKAGRAIVGGTLTSEAAPRRVLEFGAEGNAFLAHGERVMVPAELHAAHPDGTYVFRYETQSGTMDRQAVTLTKRPTIQGMPDAATITLSQHGDEVSPTRVDAETDLTVAWASMAGNTRAADSALDDLIFVLAFDCRGTNVAHSGRPYQGGPYLTYADTEYVIPADSMKPGLRYSVIVEQATADTDRTEGVPSIATYATLTFLDYTTTGAAPDGEDCPAE